MSIQYARRSRVILSVVLVVVLLQPEASLADKAGDDFNLGVGLWRKKRWTPAIDVFERFLKEYPNHQRVPLAVFYLGLSYNSLQQYRPSRDRFEEYLKLNPDSPNTAAAMYRIGECSYYLREYEKAIEQLEEYTRGFPDDKLIDWGQLQLGESLIQTGRWPEADVILTKVLGASSSEYITRQARYSLALSLENQQKPDAAVDAFRNVARLKDARLAARALARAGTIRFRQEQYERAAALYDQIVTRFPKSQLSPAAALNAGLALYRVKKFEDAVRRFGQVPEKSTEKTEATLLAGMSLARLNRPDEASIALNAAFKAAGDTALAAEALFEMARLEQTTGDRSLALQLYSDLVERWPDDTHTPDALFNAASLQAELQETKSAEQLLNRLISAHPARATRPRVKFLNGRILIQQKKISAALEILNQVISSDDADSRSVALCLYYVARIHHDENHYGKALATARQLRPLLTSDPNQDLRGALALGAMSAIELKEFETAEELATEYLQHGQDNSDQATDARVARTVAHAGTGRYNSAILDADHLIDSAGNNPQTWTAVLHAAEIAWDRKEYAAALELFMRVNNSKAPVSTQRAGASGAAWCLFEQREFQDAAKAFSETARTWPESPGGLEARYMAVRSLHEHGETDTAVVEYAALSKDFAALAGEDVPTQLQERLQSYSLDAGRAAARLLGVADRRDESNRHWAALADRFQDADVLDEILDEWAWLNLKVQQYDEADEIYRRLLKECPKSPYAGTARLSLAESDLNAHRLDDAIAGFQAIIEHTEYADSEKSKALFHLIDIQAEKQLWEDVLKLADRFAAVYSGSSLAPRVQLLQADALMRRNQLSSARELLQVLRRSILERQLEAAPWTERIWIVLAEVALAAKDYEEVDSAAKEFAEKFPESRLGFKMSYALGRRWKNQPEPDFEKAREFFEQAIHDKAGSGTRTAAKCQFLIADTMLMKKDYLQAGAEYYKVYFLYRYPDLQAQALSQAADCEHELGRRAEAIKTWQSLIEEFPDSSLAEQAQQRLKETVER